MRGIDYVIFVVIALFEVLLFNSSESVKLVFSIVQYGLIILLFFNKPERSLLYFLAFTLFCIGEWSYVMNSETSNSFLFLRVS